MTIAPVAGQATSTAFGVATGGTLTLTNNPTAGNLVVVCVATGAGLQASMVVSDSASNSYTQAAISPVAGNSLSVLVFYLFNAPANANKSIVISGGANTDTNAWAIEFSGAKTISTPYVTAAAVSHTSATSSTNINDPTISPTDDGDLLVSVCAAGQSITGSATSPWTGIDVIRNGNWAEYYVQSAHAAQAIGFTQSPAGIWTALAVAFLAAASTVSFIASPDDPSSVIVESFYRETMIGY